ncbi:MAG: transposase [Planctomycetes bacterium]|nr:transposase [Planctomycetota bacterium]
MEHADKDTLKWVFRDHWDAFKAASPRYNTEYHNGVVAKMLDCGDPEKMGFVQYRCLYCGETRRIAFSCKSSFCLSCAKPYTDRWVGFVGRRLLPGVVYRHIVLTVPDFLRVWFYRNPGLLSPLMRAGAACVRDVFSRTAGVELDIGSIVVLQTAGRPGNYNPHLHILLTGGGLNPEGGWTPVSYIPFELVHRKWQYYLLTLLREEVADRAVERAIDQAWRGYPRGFVAFVDKGKVPPGGEGLARYLAKYVVSPPISVRRIEGYDGRSVSYWYHDHKTGQVEHATLPVLKFIGRMVQHILPKGFQRIRYYGLHGNTRYAQARQTLATVVPASAPPDPQGFRVLPRKPFRQLFFESFGRDPLLCPRCKSPMELERIVHPKYGIIKDYFETFFTELTDDEPAGRGELPGRGPLDDAERVVQIPLPFLQARGVG